MAITQRFSTNAAVQYNESLSDYLINDSDTDKKFLTNAPLNRLIRENELSALYFLIDDAGFTGSTILKFIDENGEVIYSDYQTITSSYNIHNGVIVGFSGVPYYVPSNTKKICALISSFQNLFTNSDFTNGSGNLFTGWTLGQPSRTNLFQYSKDQENAYWTKNSATITPNAIVAPDGTTTGNILYETAVNDYHGILKYNVLSTNTLTFYVIAKKKDRDYFYMIFNDSSFDYLTIFNLNDGSVTYNPLGNTTYSENLGNGWYLFAITRAITDGGSDYVWYGPTSSPTSPLYLGDITKGVYIWESKLEVSPYPTPIINTTNAPVTTSTGEIVQDATGGLGGTRCLKLWVNTGDGLNTYIGQSKFLEAGTTYEIEFWAKASPNYTENYITGPDEATLIDSTDWKKYTNTFVQGSSGTFAVNINYTNAQNYGFILLDKVTLKKAGEGAITEERCFILDERCFDNENQIQWINKLGGVDTWTFTGKPIERKLVSRSGIIEKDMQGNFSAPNEMISYRDIQSTKTKSLFHRTSDEATAVWLRDELLDSMAVFVKVGTDFYPVIPLGSEIVVKNYAQKDFNVRFDFRFAFDVNIQTR